MTVTAKPMGGPTVGFAGVSATSTADGDEVSDV